MAFVINVKVCGEGERERKISWILLCDMHCTMYFTFMTPSNPHNNVTMKELYFFPLTIKDAGLSNFLELTTPKGENLSFHIGQFNYKIHPLATMFCLLSSFPCFLPWVFQRTPFQPYQSWWTSCIFYHRPLFLSPNLLFPIFSTSTSSFFSTFSLCPSPSSSPPFTWFGI